MDNRNGNQIQRHLAHLKVVSRLLGHELHTQGTSKTITLSREQVLEMQTSIDLFIEEASRRAGSGSSSTSAQNLPTAGETHLVPTRN